jgi:hypothetical protein
LHEIQGPASLYLDPGRMGAGGRAALAELER